LEKEQVCIYGISHSFGNPKRVNLTENPEFPRQNLAGIKEICNKL
jgi:hypothetical protein